MQRMRILIQRKSDGRYFQDVDAWAAGSAEAMDFLSASAAIDFCILNKLKDVQIVLKFEEQEYDIVLPLGARGKGDPKAASTGTGARGEA